jgi:hypothetical protein
MGGVRRLSDEQLEGYRHLAPRELAARVRLVSVPFLTRGTDATTLGRVILVRRGHEDSPVLMAHELVHVRQWAELGVPRFLVRYLGAYLANLARLRRHRSAYLAIPLEVEARELAREWDRRRGASRRA